VKRGDIIKHNDIVTAEGQMIQKGMNFKVGNKNYGVFLMSVRADAPYNDKFEDNGSTIIYEGHDMPKFKDFNKDPKTVDQPLYIAGTITENGKFMEAANASKKHGRLPKVVKVYEKFKSGIWAYNGFFNLTDAWIESDGLRNVCKFRLEMIDEDATGGAGTIVSLEHNRLIPSDIKAKVWARDKGCCIKCGAKANLHFDHIIPYSKGGSSKTDKNIQILCANCNFEKRDKIQ